MKPGSDMEHDPQLAALYRAATTAEPPAHLDDAIRAAARREIAAGPRRAGVRRWALPVSLAALLVLSVSVVTLMREQGADRPESLIQPPTQNPAAAMQSEIAKKEIAGPPGSAAPEAVPGRRPAAPPPVVAPAETMAQPEAPVPVLSGRAAEAERGGAESRAKAMAAESSRGVDAAAVRREYAPQPQLRPAPAPMADAAGGAGVSAAQSAAPAAALSAVPARSALWQDLVKEPPEKWRLRIAELRRDGKNADADALAAEYRRRFPDQPLPEDQR